MAQPTPMSDAVATHSQSFISERKFSRPFLRVKWDCQDPGYPDDTLFIALDSEGTQKAYGISQIDVFYLGRFAGFHIPRWSGRI